MCHDLHSFLNISEVRIHFAGILGSTREKEITPGPHQRLYMLVLGCSAYTHFLQTVTYYCWAAIISYISIWLSTARLVLYLALFPGLCNNSYTINGQNLITEIEQNRFWITTAKKATWVPPNIWCMCEIPLGFIFATYKGACYSIAMFVLHDTNWPIYTFGFESHIMYICICPLISQTVLHVF